MACSHERIAMSVSVISCLLLFFFTTLPLRAASLFLDAGSAALMDMRGKRLLYEQDSARKIPPASLTKVMSIFVVLDAVKTGRISLRAPVRVSGAAARTGGSSMRLKAGERISLEDLLRGMAVASANDAAVAVAEHTAGSQAAFVAMMNRKAAQIGMRNTVFKTPHGLPAKGQLTTAADMLHLAGRYLEAHPTARRYHSAPAIFHKGVMLPNTNKLLGHDSVDGLKTGFTRASGYNIILTSNRHGREMVGVLMRAPSVEIRTREAQRLLDYGASLLAASSKKKAKSSDNGRIAKSVKTAHAHSEKLAGATAATTRPAKKKKARPAAFVADKKVRTPPTPRRILPQTASLSDSGQGSRLR